MGNKEALELLTGAVKANSSDTVLDVACGAGFVVCEFAGIVNYAVGVDLTPAMIKQAKNLQADKRLKNVYWQIGDARSLPFSDESFSVVISRYAFHHLPQPQKALIEMKRICRKGGKLVLVDAVAPSLPEKADALNRMERLRDSSHVRFLKSEEIFNLFMQLELTKTKKMFYTMEQELEHALARSFLPGSLLADEIRRIFTDSLQDDAMGVNARFENGQIRFSLPNVIFIAENI